MAAAGSVEKVDEVQQVDIEFSSTETKFTLGMYGAQTGRGSSWRQTILSRDCYLKKRPISHGILTKTVTINTISGFRNSIRAKVQCFFQQGFVVNSFKTLLDEIYYG